MRLINFHVPVSFQGMQKQKNNTDSIHVLAFKAVPCFSSVAFDFHKFVLVAWYRSLFLLFLLISWVLFLPLLRRFLLFRSFTAISHVNNIVYSGYTSTSLHSLLMYPRAYPLARSLCSLTGSFALLIRLSLILLLGFASPRFARV